MSSRLFLLMTIGNSPVTKGFQSNLIKTDSHSSFLSTLTKVNLKKVVKKVVKEQKFGNSKTNQFRDSQFQ